MNTTSKEATLLAPDISCGQCVMTVKNAVGALPGVARVDASSDTKQVHVVFDPNQVTTDQIESTLDKAGYPVQR